MWRRKCILKHVFEGKIEGRVEVTERRRRRRRRMKLPDDRKERREYWSLKEETQKSQFLQLRSGRCYEMESFSR